MAEEAWGRWGELDQRGESPARGPTQRLHRCALVFVEPAQWAIQMNVRGVQETHGHSLNAKLHNDLTLSV